MAAYVTHKRTPEGKRQTLSRRSERVAKRGTDPRNAKRNGNR